MNEHVNCQSILDSLSDYVDGTLKDELCRDIEQHIASCLDCRIVVDTLKKTIYLYHATSATEEMPEDVRERLFLRLNLDDYLDQK
jgi:predicted anti-sigma-YlaC factor YlaD